MQSPHDSEQIPKHVPLNEKSNRSETPPKKSGKQPKVCENEKCKTSSTPLWRKGWISNNGQRVRLCNACGLHFRKGHYCKYCKEIYRDVFELEQVTPWISCERCERWAHIECAKGDVPIKPHYLCADCVAHTPQFLKEKQKSKQSAQYNVSPQQAMTQDQLQSQQMILLKEQIEQQSIQPRRNSTSPTRHSYTMSNQSQHPPTTWTSHSFDNSARFTSHEPQTRSIYTERFSTYHTQEFYTTPRQCSPPTLGKRHHSTLYSLEQEQSIMPDSSVRRSSSADHMYSTISSYDYQITKRMKSNHSPNERIARPGVVTSPPIPEQGKLPSISSLLGQSEYTTYNTHPPVVEHRRYSPPVQHPQQPPYNVPYRSHPY